MTSKSVRFIFFDYSVLRYNLSSSRKIDSRCEWALVNGDSIVGKYALRSNAVRAQNANRYGTTLEVVKLLPLDQG